MEVYLKGLIPAKVQACILSGMYTETVVVEKAVSEEELTRM